MPLAVMCVTVFVALVMGCERSPEDATAPDSAHPIQASNAAVPETHPPNLVIVTIDTLRPDYLELHGYDRETAPFLNRLANESVVFDNAYSTSSWTAPATASILTGLYPTEHGLQLGLYYQQGITQRILDEAGHGTHDGDALPFHVLPEATVTLAERLKASGYATYALTANINITERLNFHQGFDFFRGEHDMPAGEVRRLLSESVPHIQSRAPYFLYVHLMDPHWPYLPGYPYLDETPRDGDPEGSYAPASYEDSKRRADAMFDARDAGDVDAMREMYLNEITYMDRELERLYDAFSMDQNTVLIVVTDHGEEFHDHGGLFHGPTLYDELNRALMIVRTPETEARPGRVAANVNLVDVVPTALDLLALPPITEEISGLSLAPAIRSPHDTSAFPVALASRALFAQRVRVDPESNTLTEVSAAIAGTRKLIVDELPGAPTLLFDLAADPHEQTNIADAEPETVAELQRQLDAFRDAKVREPEFGIAEFTDELREELDALGYVQ